MGGVTLLRCACILAINWCGMLFKQSLCECLTERPVTIICGYVTCSQWWDVCKRRAQQCIGRVARIKAVRGLFGCMLDQLSYGGCYLTHIMPSCCPQDVGTHLLGRIANFDWSMWSVANLIARTTRSLYCPTQHQFNIWSPGNIYEGKGMNVNVWMFHVFCSCPGCVEACGGFSQVCFSAFSGW